MRNDVTHIDNCSANSTRPRNGFFWNRRGQGWSDTDTRFSGGAHTAISLSRVPR
jgi:hypothetical protein